MNKKTDSVEYRSIQTLKGVGPAVAEKLKKLEIYCVQDVLFHLPLRYEDRTTVVPIGTLVPGQRALVEGVIEHSEIKISGRRGGRGKRFSNRQLLCHLADGSGALQLRFFYFNAAQQQILQRGNALRCFGEARASIHRLEMTHPEYQRISMESLQEDSTSGKLVSQALTPVYPKTEGVHQSMLFKLSEQVLTLLEQTPVEDWLPDSLIAELGFPSLQQALHEVHRPPANTHTGRLQNMQLSSQQRLIFEELLAHQLSLMTLREKTRLQLAEPLILSESALSAFHRSLGFDLTQAQQSVIAEILSDLQQATPMLRLLQGDVGSGKTVVAASAALAAAENGFQVAIMAPTEILAEQHYNSFSQWFSGADSCLLLTGKDKGKARQEKIDSISQGNAKIIIGTHALYQDDILFNHLVLLVVDEQHRFGVHQRRALREKGRKGQIPHQLIMTATPIPRSLAMTAYADLDYSVIDELPSGRKPVTTVVVSSNRREEVIARVAAACQQGEQAYWVCTLVEESEILQCQAAETTAQELAAALPELSIALVHGRMKAEEKQNIVQAFKARETDLLVATTVIEVGVDVPDASLMVIENAERLGLAQLHQLRGRVGRGNKQSACVLMYQPPLSETGKQRLAILRETTDGFEVAKKDMEMRGPGEVLGTRQTGLIQMRIADLVRDEKWLNTVKRTAQDILKNHPQIISPLIRRWLGKADRFGQV